MSFKKTQLLVLAALSASSALGTMKHLDFCKKDKAQCEAKCTSSNGYLIEIGKFNNLTHHHNKGGLHGFICLPYKMQKCSTFENCQTDACCSNAYGLLDENNKVCLPSRFCNIQRAEGESCITDSMCASKRCSKDGQCHALTVTQKLNQAKKQESSGIPRRGYVEGAKTEKRNLESTFSSYSFNDYSDLSSSLSSLSSSVSSSLTSLAGTYTYSQYCSTYKASYYSKAYLCPASLASSASSLANSAASSAASLANSASSALNGLSSSLAGFGGVVSTARNIYGAIIGGIVGGVVFIIILIVICCYCCCKKKAAAVPQTPAQPVMQPVMQPMQPAYGQPQPIVINV